MRTSTCSNLTFASFVLLTALVAAPCARAHEFRLAAWRDSAHANTVAVRAGVGQGLATEWRPFDPSRAVRFIARTSRTFDLTRLATRGDTVWARLADPDPGGTMLVYESDFASITLDADRFDTYLAEDGLDDALAARRAGERVPGRERYRRCAKVWLAGSEPARATAPVGSLLEIVPLSIPGGGASLTVRVLYQGRVLEHALVHAWCRTSGAIGPIEPASSARTDARGEVTLDGLGSGEWLIGTVHMVPSREREAADWESTWASLVFFRPSGPAEARAAR